MKASGGERLQDPQCPGYPYDVVDALKNIQIPTLNASASRDKAGKILLTICNLDLQKAAELPCPLKGLTPKAVRGRVLTAEAVNSHNTFEKPAVVEPKTFNRFKLEGDRVQETVPSSR